MVAYTKVAKSEAIRPRDGICLTNRYWIVTPKDEIMYYMEAPQCNNMEALSIGVRDRFHPDCTVEFLEVVFTGRFKY